MRPISLLSMFSVLCGLACGSGAQAAECSGTAIAPSLQTAGRSAAGVLTVGSRIILIDDAGATKQLLICDVQTGAFAISERVALPDDIGIMRIGAEGPKLILETLTGRRDENVGARISTASPTDLIPPDGFSFNPERLADGRVLLRGTLTANPAAQGSDRVEVTVSAVVPNTRVSSHKVVQVDPVRRAVTVFWDEVGFGTRAFIATFVDGRLLAGAQIPLQDSDTIPENFAGMLADGRAYYLQTRNDKSVPVLLELDQAFAEKARPDGPLVEKWMREWRERDTQARQRRGEVTNPSAQSAVAEDLEFQRLVRQKTKDEPRAAPPIVTRMEVGKCAEEYRDLVWTLTPGSYQRSSVPNECSPQALYWKRPYYLNNRVGQQITSVPYCWGCSVSIEDFKRQIQNETHLAGHSCTCRRGHWCIRDDSTGVDCSGFVSQCWRSGYHTTSQMREIADPIDERDVKLGDVFNQSNSHVRLFMGFAATSTGDRFRVTEAANGEGSIARVVEERYTASQLSSYTPLRYRKITD